MVKADLKNFAGAINSKHWIPFLFLSFVLFVGGVFKFHQSSGSKEISSFGQPASFTLEFPATTSLGELWLIEDVNCFTCGTGEKNLGQAMGKRQ